MFSVETQVKRSEVHACADQDQQATRNLHWNPDWFDEVSRRPVSDAVSNVCVSDAIQYRHSRCECRSAQAASGSYIRATASMGEQRTCKFTKSLIMVENTFVDRALSCKSWFELLEECLQHAEQLCVTIHEQGCRSATAPASCCPCQHLVCRNPSGMCWSSPTMARGGKDGIACALAFNWNFGLCLGILFPP